MLAILFCRKINKRPLCHWIEKSLSGIWPGMKTLIPMRVAFAMSLIAGFFAIAAAYLFLSFISSSDIDFGACNGTYSLDAANPACQIPVIIGVAFVAFLVLAVLLLSGGFILLYYRHKK